MGRNCYGPKCPATDWISILLKIRPRLEAVLLKIMIFVLFILTFKFHLLQKSSNLQRRVCKPLADLDKSTMSSAYIRQGICGPQLPSFSNFSKMCSR